MQRIQREYRTLNPQGADQFLHQLDFAALVIVQLTDAADQLTRMAKKRHQRGKTLFLAFRLLESAGDTLAINGDRLGLRVLLHPAIELPTHGLNRQLSTQALQRTVGGRFITW